MTSTTNSIESLAKRINELELKTAWFDDFIEKLNQQNHLLENKLDLQQKQLQLIFNTIQDITNKNSTNNHQTLLMDKPPHY